MKTLHRWRQQDLTPESRARLEQLLVAQRDRPDDEAAREALLDAFLASLSEPQLVTFARLVRELTQQVH